MTDYTNFYYLLFEKINFLLSVPGLESSEVKLFRTES